MVSPFGVSPLRNANDLLQVNRIRALSPNIAVASLSSRYVRAVRAVIQDFRAVRAVIQDFFRSNETSNRHLERSVGTLRNGQAYQSLAG